MSMTTLSNIAIVLLLPLIAIPFGWIIGVLARKVRTYSARQEVLRQTTIVAEYEPPDDLKPAEIAFLYDSSFGQPELLATLFDLERRHMLRLHPHTAGKSTDFIVRVECKGTEDTLADFEQELIFKIKAMPTPSWSKLKTNTAIWDSDIEKMLEFSLRTRHYFWPTSAGKRLWPWFLTIGVILALAVIVVPVTMHEGWLITTPAPVANPHDQLSQQLGMVLVLAVGIVAGLVYALIAFYTYSTYMRAMDMEQGTNRLRLLWPHIEGFRAYLIVVEQDRIQFENQHLKNRAKSHALPYAIALGLSTNWQDRFEHHAKITLRQLRSAP